MGVTQGVPVRAILVDPCAYLISSADGPVAGDEDIDVARRALEQPQRGGVVLDRVSGVVQVEQRNRDKPLDDLAELDRAFRQALARVTAGPGLIAPAWTLYALTAEEVEFWQGDLQRRHVRLRYQRAGRAWTRQLLWP
jgi:Pyridoxine 5'-phosphate oxidase C-terminal dimerisation region